VVVIPVVLRGMTTVFLTDLSPRRGFAPALAEAARHLNSNRRLGGCA